MRILNKLNPKRVFYYFEDICSIPHGSGNSGAISEYCVNFAVSHNLEYINDEHNNVIIKKKASHGYEQHPPVIIQGHLDMVCEKEQNYPIDFTHDSLVLNVSNDTVFATGTTLGGDDGIAIAMALAVLEDNSLCHPPLEVVFTTDEETGMYGAAGIDTSNLSGKTLLNIDSEKEGILTVGCAGGARVDIDIDLTTEKAANDFYKITLCGLTGGHSGIDIDKNRANANTLMGKFLSKLPFEYHISDIRGGLKDNAIPRICECVVSTYANIKDHAELFVRNNSSVFEPNLTINVEKTHCNSIVFDRQSTEKIVRFLSTVTNGIVSMSADIKGLVQTSLNLGILNSDNCKLHASFAVRSSVNEEKTQLIDRLYQTAMQYGGSFRDYGHYPAWEYKKESRLRDVMVSTFKRMYGKEPVIEAIHAGLECGLFCDKIKDLDAVSFGPDIEDIHTTKERLYISSTERTYNYLCEILKEL